MIPEGDYLIRSRNSNRVVDVANNGVNIIQGSLNGQSEDEMWHIQVLDSGAYVITSIDSNEAIQVNENFNVQRREYVQGANQQWVIEPAAEVGYFYLRNLGDNRYMDVFRARTTANTNIITWPFHGRNNQQWEFELIEE